MPIFAASNASVPSFTANATISTNAAITAAQPSALQFVSYHGNVCGEPYCYILLQEFFICPDLQNVGQRTGLDPSGKFPYSRSSFEWYIHVINDAHVNVDIFDMLNLK